MARTQNPNLEWTADLVILDVMPTDSSILGFGNRWYESAIDHAEWIQLPSTRSIRMVSSAYFLITKLEAFDGRGRGDYLMSHDMEDIVAVLDGRPELVNEVRAANAELANELAERFKGLLQEDRFVDSVSGHMLGDTASQARVSLVLNKMKEIARIA